MATDCPQQLTFWERDRQQVTVAFNRGRVVTDAGLLPLRLLDKQLGVWSTIAQRLPDPRAQQFVTHTREALLTQEVYPILAGYPDGNDAQQLRHDPLFQTLVAAVPEVAKAEVGTLRQQLWKVGVVVKTSVRRIGFPFSETWPHQRLFVAVYQAVCSFVASLRGAEAVVLPGANLLPLQ